MVSRKGTVCRWSPELGFHPTFISSLLLSSLPHTPTQTLSVKRAAAFAHVQYHAGLDLNSDPSVSVN